MSKQSNDQDEPQKPSGAAQGGAKSTTPGNQTDTSGKGRSRRRGKGGQPAATAAGGSSSSAAADSATPSRAESAAGGATTSGSAAAASGPSSGTGDAGKREPSTTAGPAGKAAGAGTGKEAPKPGGGAGGGARAASATGGSGNGKGSGKAGLLALVLVIVLAVGVALLGWLGWQQLDAQRQRLAELESQSASQTALAELESRLDAGESERDAALESAIGELQSEFAGYRSEVDDTLDRVLAELASEQETDERDWLHAEAAYLLRLANQRLQLERDVQGAAALLRTADDRLREADNPALVPVRREIAAELAALDAVPRVDRTGLWLALNAQQTQIARQPLGQDIEEQVAGSSLEQAPSGGWQQQLSRFGQELKDLVTVRHHDEALEALITPEQESYLRQSVRLVLEQAQLALLKEEQALYEASLDKALTLINGYYDTDANGVRSVVTRLEALKGEAIRPELPDISGSQQALAGFIERRFESRSASQGNGARGDDA
ncbi:uroporphyrinogen-III C-methyltransferase [Halomonas sp. EGI 63088]|uniref:Uroporphyrinogen-III C-methyltransferase n=1 Tax=Halomonas flagellata TaxID=2920385 RepID=A0ABS9RXU9_9GAMM|nr:uroporphyrinogen-III C-methyltransferase [Halomonas flagellata]MCH4564667.1 uroporphyrinogen-III C-methyltransferase [Halomonas flagellata]